MNDAIITARGKLNGRTVIVSAMEYAFIGGSMGAVVGEVITRAIERALEEKVPLIIVAASGGARMMEGADQIFAGGKIQPGFPADRTVHHGEQRGRDLHIIDAAQITRGPKSAQVTRYASADHPQNSLPGDAVGHYCIERQAVMAEKASEAVDR